MHVLISEKGELHLPIYEINPNKNFHSTLHKFMVVSKIVKLDYNLFKPT